MNSTTISNRPDFVMMGFKTSDGMCNIIASADLVDGNMEMNTDAEWDHAALRYRPSNPTTSLTTRMRQWQLSQAPTYEQALAALLQNWKPDEETSRKAIESPLPAIEAGS